MAVTAARGITMKGHELKQLRKLLFLEASEAAKLIGDCETRSWQRWEKGDRAIPTDVINTIQMLSLTQSEMLQLEFNEGDPNYCYFDTFEDFKKAGGAGNELKWRLAQSISARLLMERAADAWQQEETIFK
jgi:hypothetical protein